ncbi:MAG: hypothetical protein M1445_10785 [Bacteroidetes bacterium]|nr:hypothetical protein [Bacteroidota bacterium]
MIKPEYKYSAFTEKIIGCAMRVHSALGNGFQLGVSKGYISQVMKGEFNYTLKKLIELSLAVGKAPVISFKPISEIIQTEPKEVASPSTPSLNRVADSAEPYPDLRE